MRKLELCQTGSQAAVDGFVCDQVAMALASSRGLATARIWWRPREGVSLGRFHRMPFGIEGLERRITGGRPVPTGPGIVAVTLVFPGVDWLAPGGSPLRPDQVLNRALRPPLAMLRTLGLDVFYPGRDLVTVDGQPIGHASFTVAPDGVCVVEIHCALTQSLAGLAELLPGLEPNGIAAVDASCFGDAPAMAEIATVPSGPQWGSFLESSLAAEFGCEVEATQSLPDVEMSLSESAGTPFRAFQKELGPASLGCVSSAAITPLGAVEATAQLDGDTIRGLQLTGDLIAPFHTLEEVAAACEGQLLRPAVIRRCLVGVLSKPRNFVLGFSEIDELIGRMN